jgi:hypothetical protein
LRLPLPPPNAASPAQTAESMADPAVSQIDGKVLDGLQFRAKVYGLFENIRSTPEGRSRLRMRASEVEKKLVEELLPICKYVQTKYRAGRYISVKWVNGSQQFDAEISQSGAHVELGDYPAAGPLELMDVMHPNDYLSNRQTTSARSSCTTGCPSNFVRSIGEALPRTPVT